MSPVLPLSPKQLESVATSTAEVNLWHGSIRSGKTLASLLRWLIYVASAPRGGVLVVVARTRDSAFRNVFAPMMDPSLFGPLAAHVSYTSGAPTGVILGRVVHVLGASDKKAERVLRGLTCAGAYVDEATVIEESFFTQLLGRLSVKGAQLFTTTNPDSPAHWLKRRYLDRLDELPNWRTFAFTMDDNPSLTDEYKAARAREFTGLWHRRFILGHWVAAEGAVYDMWSPADHVVAWSALPDMVELYAAGLDYGTTNPTAAVILGRGVDNRLYLVDEWRHDPAQTQRRLTDAQLSGELRAWLGRAHHPRQTDFRPKWLVVDPSAASFRVQLGADGVRGLTEADNAVAYGIRLTASLLSAGALVVADQCRGFITEVPGYSWSDSATAEGRDAVVKVADHSLDAARYALTTTERLWRRHIQLTV
ncbi:PBSX family phage terminase large subunit [Nocardiopsis alba]|uniref:PBSX family phage terminase large subunit n=1 Tax=Nocardiopsis alba TaxID=53437 RepID=UPI0035DE6325